MLAMRRRMIRGGLAAISTLTIGVLGSGRTTPVGAQPTCTPVVDHLEFTQAIQEGLNPSNPPIEPAVFNGPPPANAVMPPPKVPLVDGRFVGLRAYVKEATGGSGCPDNNGDGRPDILGNLSVSSNGNTLIAQGQNRRSVMDLVPPWDRRITESTMNWTFNARDPGAQDRPLVVQVCVRADISQSSWQCVSQQVTMLHRRQPEFMAVPVTFKLPGGSSVTPDPAVIAPGAADRALWAEWPFPTGRQGGGYRVGPGFTWSFGPIDDTINGNRLLGLLTEHQCRMRNGQPDYMFGWLHQDADLVDIAGGAPPFPAHQAFGQTIFGAYQTTYAHELGHNFGFSDAPGPIVEVGWSATSLMGMIGARMPNLLKLMDNGNGANNSNRWVNVRGNPSQGGGYENVLLRNPTDAYKRFRVTGICSQATPSAEQMLVLGVMPGDPNVPGTLEPIFGQPDGDFDTTPGTQGDGLIELQDASGAVLYSTRFALSAQPGGGEPFLAPVPQVAGLDRVVLKRAGVVQAVRARSANAPQVTVTSPTNGAALGTTTTVAWTATDLDNDPLTSMVLYSPDNGTEWIPLSGRTTGTQFTADLSGLPSGSAIKIRVQVTDGLNTTTVDVGNLSSLPDRTPRVTILAPSPTDTARSGENVAFIASAYDPETGWVDPATIKWYSNLQGFIGTGEVNTNQLVVGNHVITAATNLTPSGMATSSIQILP